MFRTIRVFVPACWAAPALLLSVTLAHVSLAQALGAQSPAAPGAPVGDRITGTIRDTTGQPIAGASLALVDGDGRRTAGRSDATGRFALVLPGSGRHVLTVRALGYQAVTREFRRREVDALDVRLTPARTLAPVTVVGAAMRGRSGHPDAADVLTSVSVLGAEQIARENVQFAQEVLRKVPGVYHANFNQGIISGDIGIRGFNTESDVASVKLLVDGIPTNLNSGLGEFNALFPLEIERIETVRGTNDPRYGLFNLAGNVGVTTRQGGSYSAVRALGGSFGTQEAQGVVARELTLGRNGRVGTLSQTWFGGWRAADGWRGNSALEKRAGSGKLFWTSADARVRLGVTARLQSLDTDAPGYLTASEARVTPRVSPTFADADGGTVDTRQVHALLEVRPSDRLAWSARLYDQRFQRTRWVRFAEAGAQQERVEDERQRGAITEVTWRPAGLDDVAGRISAGADWQWQDNVQQRFRTVARVRGATLRDYAFDFGNRGGYVRTDATFGGRLHVDAGLRVDKIGGDFQNVATGAALPVLAYGWIPQPKASASLALAHGVSAYANYGRGFQTGTGIAAYGRQPLTYSKNDGYEAGAMVQTRAGWSLRAGAWRQDASDEVRLRFDNSGDSENVGRTRRTGLDLEASAPIHRTLSVWAALTTQRAILVEPGARAPQQRGNELNHVPNWNAKYGADWTPHRRVTASFWAYGQGDYFLTDDNQRPRFGGYTAVNADVSLRLARGVGVGLGVQNAFNRYFEYVWLDGTITRHSPANPRSVFLSLRYDR